MGLTKMTEGMKLADMKRPRGKLPAPSGDVTAGRIPASSTTGDLPNFTNLPLSPTSHTPP